MARQVEHCLVLWAKKSFPGRRGTCVAVRLRDGRVSVAIRHSGFIEWLPAERALSAREAEVWARTGF